MWWILLFAAASLLVLLGYVACRLLTRAHEEAEREVEQHHAASDLFSEE